MKNKKNHSNPSGTVGVYWRKRDSKWQAEIKVDGERHYLGRYSNLNEAIAVRKAAEEKYFGEFVYKEAN